MSNIVEANPMCHWRRQTLESLKSIWCQAINEVNPREISIVEDKGNPNLRCCAFMSNTCLRC